MKVPVVKQCCCGCTLETGTTIIGWLDLIGAILTIFGAIGGFVAKTGHSATIANSVILLLCGALMTFVSIMLLIGVRRRLPRYVHYWIIVSAVIFVLTVLSTLIQSLMLMINGHIGEGFGALLGGAVVLALLAYFIIVVYNFKREISGETNQV